MTNSVGLVSEAGKTLITLFFKFILELRLSME